MTSTTATARAELGHHDDRRERTPRAGRLRRRGPRALAAPRDGFGGDDARRRPCRSRDA